MTNRSASVARKLGSIIDGEAGSLDFRVIDPRDVGKQPVKKFEITVPSLGISSPASSSPNAAYIMLNFK
jgi:hypothetical protein